MIKVYKDQKVDWQVSFEFSEHNASEEKFLSVRPGFLADRKSLILSLGEKAKFDAKKARRAAAKAVHAVKEFGGSSAVLNASVICRDALAMFLEGAALAQFQPESWRTDQKKQEFAVYIDGLLDVQGIIDEVNILADSVCFVRDMVNRPANKLTPEMMAQSMKDAVADTDVKTEILSVEQMRALGMDALLSVGLSAVHTPRLIVLRYEGNPDSDERIALVGKGVTMDTGGYCLKPSKSMLTMNGDMGGGAAVCGCIVSLAKNNIPINAVAVIPAAENRISSDSLVPGDVIGSMSGKTIEVGNTDAEGRLLLADAITYAIRKEGATRIVDIATLTGAVVTMFGSTTAGMMSNDDAFCELLNNATQHSGEQYWRLPTFPEYEKLIESRAADVYNTSKGGCSTITAGLFIRMFCEEKSWIHLDIAGTSWVSKPEWEYQTTGATGAGVTTLYYLCKELARA